MYQSKAESTIIAMVDGLPQRVECDNCHGQHNHHLAPGQLRPAKTKSSRSRRSSPKNARWERLLSTDDSPEAKFYSITKRFEAAEHESFGIMIVQQVQLGNKVEVLFKLGKKLLVDER